MKLEGINSIGVVGAGVMGTGVAQKFAEGGYQIKLIDISEKVLKKSKVSIGRNIMFHNMMNKEKLDKDSILGKIETSTSYEDLKNVDVIIENIPEIVTEKLKLYKMLSEITKKECVFLVNTSCIPIGKIASVLKYTEKVIGVHFMNPVPMQHFAEVIKAETTSQEVISFVKEFLKSVEVDCTVINDSPGFVSNRLSHLFMNEAANLVMEGVATPEQIDMIFTNGFHHETGPLHTADLIGIDTVVNSLDVLYEFYQEPKFECSPYLRKMVTKNELGCKSGKGFFNY
ncbi:3-hydroxyacyl-CoA dehydrogenase family protein [Clostridium felsineum]|uniref:3-hydroxyacyl-CoA dehydrogenase family protein n=1 Tax=Clostridium felsineum TaxID=36839 RepID=UPI00098CEF0D|nr:3-hydroxyacyl-CoA dehydrogenase family protein [Clostridium felsineum]URZ01273.1 putative 3-hydroxybutyryl-CoA dehydrogenase [Clostridium felsineum]